MNRYGMLSCFFIGITFFNVSDAGICKGDGNNQLQADITKSLSSKSQTVTTCDLQNDFTAEHFPRFFWVLNKGLSQQDTKNEFLETGITLANQSVRSGNKGRAEKIYHILLTHFPRESRVISSYSVIHILRENYKEAATLLDRAVKINPNDPLILNNIYLVAILNNDYKKAVQVNKQQRKIEPNYPQHLMRHALLNKLYKKSRDDKSWDMFIKIQKSKNNVAYWNEFNTTFQKSNLAELIQVANQWIDYNMPYEAILLLDYVLDKKEIAEAHYYKAKAFEKNNHHKLAFDAASKTRDFLLKSQEKNHTFYGSVLYEVARLAYAVEKYESSILLFKEYTKKGYSHPHLDYMFAVNFNALGNHVKAKPYFKKCASQKLPENLLKYCKSHLKKKNEQVEKSKPDSNNSNSKAITIDRKTITPLAYIKSGLKSEKISWIGKIIDMSMKESGDKLHITWTAKHMQPEHTVEIVDGSEYSIKFIDYMADNYFQVDLYLNAMSKEKMNVFKEQFKDESHIIVRGKVYDVRPFKKILTAVVAMDKAIFTSKIKEIK